MLRRPFLAQVERRLLVLASRSALLKHQSLVEAFLDDGHVVQGRQVLDLCVVETRLVVTVPVPVGLPSRRPRYQIAFPMISRILSE